MLQYYVYIPILIILIVLSLLVYLKNPRSPVNRLYAAYNICIILWVLMLFIADTAVNYGTALFCVRAALSLSSLGAGVLLWFSYSFPDYRKIKKWMLIYALMPLFFTAVAFTDGMVRTISIQPWGAEVSGSGPFYFLQLLYLILYFVISLGSLLRTGRKKKGRVQSQVRFMVAGILFTVLVNLFVNGFLAIYGISKYWTLLGTASFIVLASSIAVAIIKYKLFDIRALVARSAAYVFAIVTIGATYSFLAYGLIGDFLTTRVFTSDPSNQIVNTIIAILLAYTFQPIRRFFEKITDRVFYKGRYDPQELISSIGRVLAAEIELDPLAKQVSRIISEQMRLAEANIIVLANHKIFYQTSQDKIKHIYHPAELEKIAKKPLIIDELPSGEKRQLLEQHNVSATIPLRTREGLIGHLMLGEKKSGDIFATQDIQTLHIISDELAIAIQNARSYLEIQRFNETLREKIALATKELRHANSELKDLDRAKDEFISMASHQLRTPLSAVRGYTSMVMEGDFGKLTKEQSENLKQAFDAATRMARLVDDLLNVSRIQSGKFKIERTSVDLNTVLPEEISLLSTTAKTKNVTVNYHAPEKHVPLISVDEGKTRQCVMNLIDNAIYYSASAKDGGIVDVYLTGDENAITFKVVDNGIGVPKDQQSKLFSKFYRAPNAQQTRPDGTGLGLFLVGKVISEQGGKILFESTEGKGSTFGWMLPIRGENVEKAAGKG